MVIKIIRAGTEVNTATRRNNRERHIRSLDKSRAASAVGKPRIIVATNSIMEKIVAPYSRAGSTDIDSAASHVKRRSLTQVFQCFFVRGMFHFLIVC